MKKIFMLLIVGISTMFLTACRTDSSQKGSNAPQPQNEIWYTSKDGDIVEPYTKRYISEVFGANIVSNTYQDGKGVIVFDDNVKRIGSLAFKGCTNLTSISIPEGVTKIMDSSFANCTSLTSITIPYGVTDINGTAFCECTNLTSIIIPNSVVRIGDGAFSGCKSLTSITLPCPASYVTISLGERAFCGCTSLASIYCESSNPPTLYGNTFVGVSSDCKLYVQPQSVEIYKKTTGWKRFYYTTVGYDFPSPSKSPNKIVENKQSDPTDENDIMLEEFALKVDRIIDLIYDMKESDHPFMYTKQIETLAAECEKLEKKLNAASLSSRQKLYKDEIKAELEDAIRRLTWN